MVNTICGFSVLCRLIFSTHLLISIHMKSGKLHSAAAQNTDKFFDRLPVVSSLLVRCQTACTESESWRNLAARDDVA